MRGGVFFVFTFDLGKGGGRGPLQQNAGNQTGVEWLLKFSHFYIRT
jgi:hypothetical protein